MASLTVYIPGSNRAAKFVTAELREIALHLGYVSDHPVNRGNGAISRLLVALAQGEVTVLKVNRDTVVAGLLAFVADHPDQAWARELLGQLSD
jgi:hypothetical protein